MGFFGKLFGPDPETERFRREMEDKYRAEASIYQRELEAKLTADANEEIARILAETRGKAFTGWMETKAVIEANIQSLQAEGRDTSADEELLRKTNKWMEEQMDRLNR